MTGNVVSRQRVALCTIGRRTTRTAKKDAPLTGDDWRLRGQERYLTGVVLRHKTYYRWSEDWDHDHCEFCGVRFAPPEDPDRTKEDRHEGFATLARGQFPDDYHWICEDCFGDIEQTFRWRVVD